MASQDEQILRAAKEIMVKFIECGRVSPGGFPETFRTIYQAVSETVRTPAREKPGAGSEDA
jgi:hypothetical protein